MPSPISPQRPTRPTFFQIPDPNTEEFNVHKSQHNTEEEHVFTAATFVNGMHTIAISNVHQAPIYNNNSKQQQTSILAAKLTESTNDSDSNAHGVCDAYEPRDERSLFLKWQDHSSGSVSSLFGFP
ncbi:hypothetical protein KY290_028347 [Solanum tuberosum]|uniref:Uncharacterized protein n=1 Tax=Solanum tuberosum TaxID=4113 RepID=A0ABQ7UHN0_SOLTU|nr:hypothetical protein KY290_028347 [Solanum tuberosum]